MTSKVIKPKCRPFSIQGIQDADCSGSAVYERQKAIKFLVANGGRCTSVPENWCRTIAETSGIVFKELHSIIYPPGCYFRENINKIFFNFQLSSEKACSDSRVCICEEDSSRLSTFLRPPGAIYKGFYKPSNEIATTSSPIDEKEGYPTNMGNILEKYNKKTGEVGGRPIKFMVANGNRCTSVSGDWCKSIAETGGFVFKELHSIVYPPGCYHRERINKMFFNFQLSSEETCSESRVCICSEDSSRLSTFLKPPGAIQ